MKQKQILKPLLINVHKTFITYYKKALFGWIAKRDEQWAKDIKNVSDLRQLDLRRYDLILSQKVTKLLIRLLEDSASVTTQSKT